MSNQGYTSNNSTAGIQPGTEGVNIPNQALDPSIFGQQGFNPATLGAINNFNPLNFQSPPAQPVYDPNRTVASNTPSPLDKLRNIHLSNSQAVPNLNPEPKPTYNPNQFYYPQDPNLNFGSQGDFGNFYSNELSNQSQVSPNIPSTIPQAAQPQNTTFNPSNPLEPFQYNPAPVSESTFNQSNNFNPQDFANLNLVQKPVGGINIATATNPTEIDQANNFNTQGAKEAGKTSETAIDKSKPTSKIVEFPKNRLNTNADTEQKQQITKSSETKVVNFQSVLNSTKDPNTLQNRLKEIKTKAA